MTQKKLPSNRRKVADGGKEKKKIDRQLFVENSVKPEMTINTNDRFAENSSAEESTKEPSTFISRKTR
jgi:hypothetical protein